MSTNYYSSWSVFQISSTIWKLHCYSQKSEWTLEISSFLFSSLQEGAGKILIPQDHLFYIRILYSWKYYAKRLGFLNKLIENTNLCYLCWDQDQISGNEV